MKTSQRQWLTKVAGIDGLWATFSGGEASVAHSKQYDGGSLVPDVLSGSPDFSDITVSRGFDPSRDGPVIRTLSRAISQGRSVQTTITRTPTDEDYTPVGQPEVYEVVLQKVTPSEADANSGDPSRIQLVFTVRSSR